MPVPIPTPLLTRPFTLDEARSVGLTRDNLKGSRFQHLYPAVYAVSDLPVDFAMRVFAAQLAVGPRSYASFETGLNLYSVSAGNDPDVHVSTRDRNPRRITGIVVHRHNYLGQVTVIHRCRVLSPERCLVDAANHLSLAELVAAGDGLIACGHTTQDMLVTFVTENHFDGIVLCRRAVELITPGSESFRESLVRVMLELAGLPAPECNVSYGDAEFIARVDMSYRLWLVAIEYDGRQHGLSLAQRERDVRRRELMERLGWTFVIVTAAQLGRPRDIVNRVYEALQAHGYKGPPPDFTREWTKNFERTPRFVR